MNENKYSTDKIKERIRKIREDRNLTQNQFAQKLNTSQRTVSQWENIDKYVPSIPYIIDICNTFGVTPDYILNGIEYPTYENNFIGEMTGLSDKTLKNIKTIKNVSAGSNPMLNTLNKLLEHDNFIELLGKITEYCIELPDNLANNNDKMNYTLFGIQEDFKRIIDDVSDYKVVKENITKSKLKQKKLF